MKKIITAAIVICMVIIPFGSVLAEDMPSLSEISFKGARINEAFSPDVREYTLTLEDSAGTPTLESYKIDGSAKLFVVYNLDAAKHQTGITVTLEYTGGSSEYTFDYVNAAYDTHSANNSLKDISCALCEVYPKVSSKSTNYRLYIPKDLTVLNITTVTEDVNAYCDLPKTIELSAGQEPEFSLTVTAANGDTKAYSLKIKRLNKTAEELAAEIEDGGYKEIVKSELFYNNPVFIIAVAAAAFGIIALLVMLRLFRRITVKAEDENETEFFDI